MAFNHVPVLANEAIAGLALSRGDVCVDATVGGGGHSAMLLSAVGKAGHLHAFDRDATALIAAKHRLDDFSNVTFHHTNFANIKRALGDTKANAILADIGVSSHQIDTPERGFSYMHDAPLDMRMDKSAKFSAHTIVNNAKVAELENIIRDYGEERFAKRIDANIVAARPIQTTGELAKICVDSVPSTYWKHVGHPAKKTFQAIRIAVNAELDSLEKFLHDSVDLLNPGGRIAVITFHSLEDRIVKQTFKHYAASCLCPPKTPICICGHKPSLEIITKKPIEASAEELKNNPRAASAKLRIAQKI